jgi:hypothetical protein
MYIRVVILTVGNSVFSPNVILKKITKQYA